MSYVSSLRCKECGREYPVEALNVCDFCFGPLEVVYDYEAIAKATSRERIESGPRSLWRYVDFLPADYNPDIDELRYKVAESEDEFESLRLKEEASESRVTHLKGVVQHLENLVKSAPASAGVMDERGAITQEAESIER